MRYQRKKPAPRTKPKRKAMIRRPRPRYSIQRYNLLTGNVIHIALVGRTKLIVNSDTIETTLSLTFDLTQCNNYANWTALYDQYRINSVYLSLKPQRSELITQDVNDIAPNQTFTNIPSYAIVADYDDTAIINYQDVKERHGARWNLATKSMKMKVYPKKLMQIYNGLTTAYMPAAPGYLDCTYNNVPHYGVKVAMEVAQPTGQYGIEIEHTYYVTFKNRQR